VSRAVRSNRAVPAERATRQAIIDLCRRFEALGLNQGTSGNVSVRAGDAMLITPSSTPYETMRPAMIARMALSGEGGTHEGPIRPSTEWRFHRDILRARPEIGAIVHLHSPHATALAIARRPIPPCHYMVAIFGGEDVRCARYARFGTAALSEAALAALAGRFACLLANHGMIALGATLAEAAWRAVEVEALARHYLLSLAAGGPVLLTPAEIAEAKAAMAGYGRAGKA
jgi:L-fuculose-phosphate aldolase